MTIRSITLRKVGAALCVALVGCVLVAGAANLAGVYINTTVSLPLGIYRTVEAPIAPGAYVAFCPPETPVFKEAQRRGYLGGGFCPGGYLTMMKQVLAAKGDRVTVGPEGVRVNGQLALWTAQARADGGGRPLPRYVLDTTLDTGLMLMGEASAVSFDSRYFGPVDRARVRAVIKPVFTW